jgi:hypothetical protein
MGVFEVMGNIGQQGFSVFLIVPLGGQRLFESQAHILEGIDHRQEFVIALIGQRGIQVFPGYGPGRTFKEGEGTDDASAHMP